MWRHLLRGLGPLVLALACCFGPVWAQAPSGGTGDPAQPVENREANPVFASFVALVSALIVLVIVCMPSRKGT